MISDTLRATLVVRVAGRLVAARIKRQMHAESDPEVLKSCTAAANTIVDLVDPPERAITSLDMKTITSVNMEPVSVQTVHGRVMVPRVIANDLKAMHERIIVLQAALRPLARMYRDGDGVDPSDDLPALFARRETGGHATYIFKHDIITAYRLFDDGAPPGMTDLMVRPETIPDQDPKDVLITQLRDALRPFARMHREHDDPGQTIFSRGVASDMTVITQGDFALAHMLLDEDSTP